MLVKAIMKNMNYAELHSKMFYYNSKTHFYCCIIKKWSIFSCVINTSLSASRPTHITIIAAIVIIIICTEVSFTTLSLSEQGHAFCLF